MVFFPTEEAFGGSETVTVVKSLALSCGCSGEAPQGPSPRVSFAKGTDQVWGGGSD